MNRRCVGKFVGALLLFPVAICLGSGDVRTESYQLPPGFFEAQTGAGASSDDPFSPSEGDPVQPAPKRSGGEHLQEFGLSFPDGATAHYDPKTGTIVMRNTAENHDLLAAILEVAWEQSPKTLEVAVHVFEIPSTEWFQIEANSKDEPKRHEAVQALVAAGEGVLVAIASVETRSGQRAKLISGEKLEFVASYETSPEKPNEIYPKFEHAEIGTVLEIDPVLGEDNQSIDLVIAFSYDTGPPQITETPSFFPGLNERFLVKAVSEQEISLTTALTVLNGRVRMIGILPGDEQGRSFVVFLKAKVKTFRD